MCGLALAPRIAMTSAAPNASRTQGVCVNWPIVRHTLDRRRSAIPYASGPREEARWHKWSQETARIPRYVHLWEVALGVAEISAQGEIVGTWNRTWACALRFGVMRDAIEAFMRMNDSRWRYVCLLDRYPLDPECTRFVLGLLKIYGPQLTSGAPSTSRSRAPRSPARPRPAR